MGLLRPTQLPPELAGRYSTNIASGATITAFELDRGAYNGVILYGSADQDLLISVDAGTDFSGTIDYPYSQSFFARTGDGFRFPCDCQAEKIRVRVTNLGGSATTAIKISAYLSTLNSVPIFQHEAITVWTAQTLTAGAGWSYSPTIDLSNSMGGQLTVVVTNGGTGPTVAPQVFLQAAAVDDAYSFGDFQALGALSNLNKLATFPTGAGVVTTHSIAIPHSIKYARVKAGQNTGQNVMASAWANLARY